MRSPVRSVLPSTALLLAVVVMVIPPAHAQVCQGSFTLSTQEQVDAFACTEVTGDLLIGVPYLEVSDITNVDGLADLTAVGNWLSINYNDVLQNVDGLANLTTVGVYLSIRGNPTLTNIAPFSSLSSVGSFLEIAQNDALANLDGLINLTSVKVYLEIAENSSLTDLDGLANLTSVGSLVISDNDALTNLNGLANVASVGDTVHVYRNEALSECTVGLGELLMDMSIAADIRDNAPGCNSYWEAIGGGVDAEDEATPLVTALAAPYPNPTAGATSLTFTLAEAAEVRAHRLRRARPPRGDLGEGAAPGGRARGDVRGGAPGGDVRRAARRWARRRGPSA